MTKRFVLSLSIPRDFLHQMMDNLPSAGGLKSMSGMQFLITVSQHRTPGDQGEGQGSWQTLVF